MPADHATALVIRGTDWSETSRITTLWTREFGKIRALAKGGRRLNSSFEVAFDLLTVCEVMVIRKAHAGLDLLTEARVLERFPQLRSDLGALYSGYYFAELLSDGTADYDPHPILFDETLNHLRKLGDPRSDRYGLLSSFELVWLKEVGYSPRFEDCAVCGTGLPETTNVLYSHSSGGVVCSKCSPSVMDRWTLSLPARTALIQLVRGSQDLAISERREVRQLLAQSVSAVLGRRPKLLAYLDGAG